MNPPAYPALQYRWQIKETDTGAQLVYFGLRNPPNHTKNIIPLPGEFADCLRLINGKIISNDLPSSLTNHEIYARLVAEGIVVEADKVRQPSSEGNYRECVRCVTNDYLLPGLEFDKDGLCAFCQCYEHAERSSQKTLIQQGVTDEELLKIAAENTRSRFDVMVLYTGGKDSTYLLWYLAKKLKLRVLVASWNMPYTNDTCRDNMRRAMRLLPDTEFIERTMPWNVVRQAMRNQFEYIGAPCLCPMAAHALFYPLAVQEKIPVIMQGVEDVQLAAISYVMTEIKSGQSQEEKPLDFRADTLNFLRLLTRPPVHAQPYIINADLFRYMSSVKKQLPAVYAPLDDIVAQAANNPDMSIPVLRRLRTSTAYGSWAGVAGLMKQEMDWQMPPGQKGLLHTSCRIEKVKDYCQFKRFEAARSVTFPQSVVELGAGVYFGLVSREDALLELQETGYYKKPEPLSLLLDDLGIDPDRASGEISWSLGGCTGCSQQGSR